MNGTLPTSTECYSILSRKRRMMSTVATQRSLNSKSFSSRKKTFSYTHQWERRHQARRRATSKRYSKTTSWYCRTCQRSSIALITTSQSQLMAAEGAKESSHQPHPCWNRTLMSSCQCIRNTRNLWSCLRPTLRSSSQLSRNSTRACSTCKQK
jgi:rubrerythrin